MRKLPEALGKTGSLLRRRGPVGPGPAESSSWQAWLAARDAEELPSMESFTQGNISGIERESSRVTNTSHLPAPGAALERRLQSFRANPSANPGGWKSNTQLLQSCRGGAGRNKNSEKVLPGGWGRLTIRTLSKLYRQAGTEGCAILETNIHQTLIRSQTRLHMPKALAHFTDEDLS